MKKLTIAVLAAAFSFAATGCAGTVNNYERAVRDAEWYDAYRANKYRCNRLGGALVVEKYWATRLKHELEPGTRYSCYLRDR